MNPDSVLSEREIAERHNDLERELKDALYNLAVSKIEVDQAALAHNQAKKLYKSHLRKLTKSWFGFSDIEHVNETIVFSARGFTFVVNVDTDGEHNHSIDFAQEI